MPRPQVETLNFWSASFWTMIDMMIRSVGSGSSANQGADARYETERFEFWNSVEGCNMSDDILEKMVWNHELEEDPEEEEQGVAQAQL